MLKKYFLVLLTSKKTRSWRFGNTPLLVELGWVWGQFVMRMEEKLDIDWMVRMGSYEFALSNHKGHLVSSQAPHFIGLGATFCRGF